MILTQPFPGYLPSAKIIRFTLLAGFVVFLILVLFRPFGIDEPENHFAVWHALLYGLGTFVTASLNAYLLPFLFKKFFLEERWNVGKELLVMAWQVISISFVNLAITSYLYPEDFTLAGIINFLWITTAVGIFPIALIILLKQQILYRRYAHEAAELERKLQQPADITMPRRNKPVQLPETIALTGDNQHELLELSLGDIRFINAADNYIKVHYLQNGKPAQTVLRSTLKKAQTGLEGHPQLFRCHRAYIVNLAAVSHISGNAQGYKLHLRDMTEPIPVSRNLNDDIALLIDQYNTVSR